MPTDEGPKTDGEPSKPWKVRARKKRSHTNHIGRRGGYDRRIDLQGLRRLALQDFP
jgi:hypothetical protein